MDFGRQGMNVTVLPQDSVSIYAKVGDEEKELLRAPVVEILRKFGVAQPHVRVFLRDERGEREVAVSDGSRAGCYFSGDGGQTARKIDEIQSGDTLHFEGNPLRP